MKIIHILSSLLACLSITLSSYTQAFTLNGRVTGEDVVWDNAISISEGMTLSSWSSPSGLTPTTKWRPGLFSLTPSSSLTLSGPSASRVVVPVSINGLEYNLGSLSPQQQVGPGGATCDTAKLSGSVVHIRDTGASVCSADFELINPASVTPFYFLRPIFTLESTVLTEALNGNPKGTYTGRIPLLIRYYYYTTSGAYTYRNINESLSVQLNYDPSFLTSVNVIGNGVMEPSYDTTLRKVSASTVFNVDAEGYFSEGLRMTFESKTYALTGPTSIPYSVQCQGGCSQNNIVTDGVLNQRIVTLSGGRGQTNIKFNLAINYNNVDVTDVETGTYTDTFTILFEPDF